LAWRMYAEDASDALVYASTGGSSGRSGGSVYVSNAGNKTDDYAWSGAHMDYTPSNLANYDPRADMQKRPLWPFTKSQTIYKCPTDRSMVKDLAGNIVPRILTMSMNLFVGGFAPNPTMNEYGNWDSSKPWLKNYGVYRKLSGIKNPSSTFVFLDMREDSVNWSNFMQEMEGYDPLAPTSWKLGDMPGMYHNRACGFSFSDGHSEIHKWIKGATTPNLLPVGKTFDSEGIDTSVFGKNNDDAYWLMDHSTHQK